MSARSRSSSTERSGAPPPKVCASCGRAFAWPRTWERCWSEVKYCSKRCAARRVGDVDQELEIAILSLLMSRGPDATIRPSEAGRAVEKERWRELNERVRNAARRMALAGTIEIFQGVTVVAPELIRGPIRLRQPR